MLPAPLVLPPTLSGHGITHTFGAARALTSSDCIQLSASKPFGAGRVIATLHKKLVAGGYLLLGHSESLINLTTAFDLVHLKNDMVYRKPANG